MDCKKAANEKMQLQLQPLQPKRHWLRIHLSPPWQQRIASCCFTCVVERTYGRSFESFADLVTSGRI